MQWHSASEFFAMGGYALYVWGSLGACAVTMLAEPWLLAQRHRRICSALRMERLAREQERLVGANPLNPTRSQQ